MRSDEVKEKADTFISTFSWNTQNSERTPFCFYFFCLETDVRLCLKIQDSSRSSLCFT